MLPLYQKKETNKNTIIMDTIFVITSVLFIGVISIMILIQTNIKLWNDIKSNTTNWFNDTKIGIWYINKNNKVEILSEWEYKNLLKSGRIKSTIIIY